MTACSGFDKPPTRRDANAARDSRGVWVDKPPTRRDAPPLILPCKSCVDKPPTRRDAAGSRHHSIIRFDKPPTRRDARASTLVNPDIIGVEGDFDSKYLRFPDTLKNLDFMRFP